MTCDSCGQKRTHLDHSRGVCEYAKPPSAFASKPRKRPNPRSVVMAAFYREQRVPLVKAVLIRDGGLCQLHSPVCVKGGEMTVHEVKTRGRFGGIRAKGVNVMENCYTACGPCNSYASEHPRWAEANGFLARNVAPEGSGTPTSANGSA